MGETQIVSSIHYRECSLRINLIVKQSDDLCIVNLPDILDIGSKLPSKRKLKNDTK